MTDAKQRREASSDADEDEIDTQPCVVPPRIADQGDVGVFGDTGRGDRQAFFAWVARLVHRHRHRTRLARVARSEGLAPDLAFDAVQEAFVTFLALPRARPLVADDDGEGARKLLVTLVRNVARNARRRHAEALPHEREAGALDALTADVTSVESLLVQAEDHVRLAGCLRTLAELPRTVVTLRMLDELPGEDVARTLGLAPGHVAVVLHRAKSTLLACMTAPVRAIETTSLPPTIHKSR